MPRGDLCLAYLAGTCRFTATTCKKRHPAKAEADKLRAKYSKTKCRYGDECKTTNCLYTHPKDGAPKSSEASAAPLLEQAAFPPLAGENNATTNKSTLLPGSAWRAAPIVTPPSQPGPPLPSPAKQQQQPKPQHVEEPANVETHINAAAPAWFPGNPQEEVHMNGNGSMNGSSNMKNLNVNAREWVPGSL